MLFTELLETVGITLEEDKQAEMQKVLREKLGVNEKYDIDLVPSNNGTWVKADKFELMKEELEQTKASSESLQNALDKVSAESDETVKAKIQELQEQHTKEKQETTSKLTSKIKEAGIASALKSENIANSALVSLALKSDEALMELVSVDENGEVAGIEELITSMRENPTFKDLFEVKVEPQVNPAPTPSNDPTSIAGLKIELEKAIQSGDTMKIQGLERQIANVGQK